MAQKDFKPQEFPTFAEWGDLSSAANVAKLREYAEGLAQDAINWYYNGRHVRRILCRTCRFLAIVLTATAGILPILMEAYPSLRIRAMHSTLCLALAALWIALDRFWGFTSGWVRYLQTGQEISALVDGFRFDITHVQLSWSNGKPSSAQAEDCLLRIRAFVLQLHSIVRQETNAWAAEFAAALKDFDEQTKSLASVNTKAAVQLNVSNGDQCESGWMVTVDGGLPERRSGKQAALAVLPGLHTIRVQGKIGQNSLTAELPVAVSPGNIAVLELTLS